jgi:hypothetical protein
MGSMLSDAEQEKLDDLRQMLGHEAGTLALVLEQLTDAMAMINLHAVYCRVEKGPRAGQPPTDVAEMLQTVEKAKELVRESLQRLRSSPA